jgi:hypothetical protein
MEATSTSETLVNFYQTTRRNIPEDSHLLDQNQSNDSGVEVTQYKNPVYSIISKTARLTKEM